MVSVAMDIEYTTRIHRDGGLHVAHAQELDVSSAGASPDEACAHLREAVALFLEEAERMGTLGDILEEAGYRRIGDQWCPPEVVGTERSRLTLPVAAR
jgi:predicted RNase H-like HicB family nuclease